MTPSARLSAALELIDQLVDNLQPKGRAADRLLADWLRARRYIGSKDRRWLSETYWQIIRQWGRAAVRGCSGNARARLLHYLLGSKQQDMLDIWLAPVGDYAPDALTLTELEQGRKAQAIPVGPESEWRDWQIDHTKNRFGASKSRFLRAFNRQATVDVRLQRGGQRSDLPDANWQAIPHVVGGWRTSDKVQLSHVSAYRDGMIEVQDMAAQLASALCAAKPGELVIDLCAGAGGKALALREAMQDTGRLIAFEPVPARLAELEKRDARGGTAWIDAQHLPTEGEARLAKLKGLKGQADLVLVDAPCSGSGTWRRAPDLRWRFDETDLNTFARLQTHLLRESADLVKPGGRLVYMTCSLYDLENEQRVRRFLKKRADFQALDYRDLWVGAGLTGAPVETLATSCEFLSLAPYPHECDGFFVAILQRLA